MISPQNPPWTQAYHGDILKLGGTALAVRGKPSMTLGSENSPLGRPQETPMISWGDRRRFQRRTFVFTASEPIGEKQGKERGDLMRRMTLAVVQRVGVGLLAAACGGVGYPQAFSPARPAAPQAAAVVPLPAPVDGSGRTAAAGPPTRVFSGEEAVNIAVYEAVNRSVANINTKATVPSGLFLLEVPSEGAGSGIVVDKQGHILTNYHVVEGAKEVLVQLYDGSSHSAALVGFDPATDVAVIKVAAPEEVLYPVAFGSSHDLRVGQRVFAIGNPFGLERTLTTGIISSLNRSLPTRSGRTVKSVIQTDAAINPGNSGGPLLDSESRLVGMNTAIASRTGQSSGVGFAIPVSTLSRVVPQLIQKGKVIRPEAGIMRVYQTDRGLLVASLTPDGPAERAGMRGFKVVREKRRQGPFLAEFERVDRRGADLIVAVDGAHVRTADDFLTAIESKNPGDRALIRVERENHSLDIPVVLAAEE